MTPVESDPSPLQRFSMFLSGQVPFPLKYRCQSISCDALVDAMTHHLVMDEIESQRGNCNSPNKDPSSGIRGEAETFVDILSLVSHSVR